MSELRKDNLNFWEALGQSVASLSPTFTPALGVAVVGGMAGSGTWLVYFLATVSVMIVGANIGQLAKRIPAAGSFFIYVSRTLGPSFGMLAGWAMLVAYLFTAVALTVATSLFFKALLVSIGVTFVIPNIIIYAVISVMLWFLAYRDIKFSSQLGLGIEAISVTAILIVCFMIWQKSGYQIDPKQVHLTGQSVGSIAPAIVFGIFSWVGYESAATLSREIRNPTVVVPRVIMATALCSGVFFMITSSVIVLGFGDDAGKLGGSSAPLNDLTTGFGSWVATLIYFGATISCFACSLGQLNAFARMLFSLGRYQFVHKSMGLVHTSHQTPHIALAVGAAANLVLTVACSKQAETDLVGYFGTIATFGFITVYFLCSIAAPLLMLREKSAKTKDIVLGVAGAICMALAFVGSVYPVPSYPYNIFPYGFVIYMLIGVAWYYFLKSKSPQTIMGIQHDLEVASS